MQPIITLDYGSGGLRTAQLIEEILVPAFSNTALAELGDGAVLPPLEGPPVLSSDSFLVSPWRFPGGEGAARIGRVSASRPGQVVLHNAFGGSRLLTKLTGAQLPRIC